MSYDLFIKSQLYKNKSKNLSKIGYDFDNDSKEEFKKIQNLLFTMYNIQNHSMLSIMKEFDIPSSKTMDTFFRLFDITSRSLSEANLNAIQTGRSNNFPTHKFIKHGWHTTWDNKQIYYRSSYEKEYANYLDEQKISYDVECFRIKYYDTTECRFRIAIPDFYIPSTNTIVEIKSNYWLDVNNMIDKKKAYKDLGFNFTLIVDGAPTEI